ncbi:DUF721 domain-containing protein [Candidatus Ozemobacteraceae bacterium]|nr:DUF721 domain-containing protein [Candidatus Ozemobacteraceae bacterium]
MNAEKPRYRSGIRPIGSMLTDTLAELRRQAWEARYGQQGGRGFSMRVARAAGSEMMQLGRLRKAWPSIVGPDVARHTAPDRLFQGKLFVVCEDSQWLQTFTFVRLQVLERVSLLCAGTEIRTAVARLGRLPATAPIARAPQWPDWHGANVSDVPETKDRRLHDLILRCKAKLQARRNALAMSGLIPCPKCGAVTVRTGTSACAVCRHNARVDIRARLRTLLDETPWLTLDEVREHLPSVTPEELFAAKIDLFSEVRATVEVLGAQLRETPDETLVPRLRFEMIRAVILETGARPDVMTPDTVDGLLPVEWKRLLEQLAAEPREASDAC